LEDAATIKSVFLLSSSERPNPKAPSLSLNQEG